MSEQIKEGKIKTPIELISEERKRQQEQEGWTIEHDDKHTDQSLAMAAALYASPDDRLEIVEYCEECSTIERVDDPWPWWDEYREGTITRKDRAWDKREDHNRMRRLQIAGALIVAEMERLVRAEDNQ